MELVESKKKHSGQVITDIHTGDTTITRTQTPVFMQVNQ